jgi:hypothetical protein
MTRSSSRSRSTAPLPRCSSPSKGPDAPSTIAPPPRQRPPEGTAVPLAGTFLLSFGTSPLFRHKHHAEQPVCSALHSMGAPGLEKLEATAVLQFSANLLRISNPPCCCGTTGAGRGSAKRKAQSAPWPLATRRNNNNKRAASASYNGQRQLPAATERAEGGKALRMDKHKHRMGNKYRIPHVYRMGKHRTPHGQPPQRSGHLHKKQIQRRWV